MSNLKQDLDEYLLLQSDQKKNFNVKLPQLKVPGLSQIFSRTSEPPEANSWLKDTQDSCCPKLVRRTPILYSTYTFKTLFYLVLVTPATHCGLRRLSGHGLPLHDPLHVLHSGADVQAKVCAALHTGQPVLHTELLLPRRLSDVLQANVLQAAPAHLNLVQWLPNDDPLLCSRSQEHRLHSALCCGTDHNVALHAAGDGAGRCYRPEILWSTLQEQRHQQLVQRSARLDGIQFPHIVPPQFDNFDIYKYKLFINRYDNAE